jgi:type II secretory pathway pseudopilin PulG
MVLDESHSKFSSESGFSLIETMVATLLLAVSLTSLAQLFALSTRANFTAKTTTTATVMAQQKMEQLRSLAWTLDPVNRLPISDFETNLATDPPTSGGGKGLSASPANALTDDVAGYVDYLDANGRALGGGGNAPNGTVWIRRWSVEPLPTNTNTLVLQVFVFKRGGRGEDLPAGQPVSRFPEEARLVTVKTRKASS